MRKATAAAGVVSVLFGGYLSSRISPSLFLPHQEAERWVETPLNRDQLAISYISLRSPKRRRPTASRLQWLPLTERFTRGTSGSPPTHSRSVYRIASVAREALQRH